jgi:glycosyltransferase involved in cell wall biosynthesis
VLFTSTLGGGGAEKHLVRLANQLHSAGHEVRIAVVRRGGSYEAELDPGVPVFSLGHGRMIAAAGRLRALIQQTNPELVLSVLDHASCVALAATIGMPDAPAVVAAVQSTPSIVHARGGIKGRFILRLMSLLFPRASAVVAISEGVKRDLLAIVPRVADRTHVIHNIGVDATGDHATDEIPPGVLPKRKGSHLLVACGRLTEQKGFSDLLDAFALLRRRHDAELWLLGEGELRPELERRVTSLGLRDRVWMPGFVPNPQAFMGMADVFVLSSLWEGFGNVIVEAMAAGTAVVSTDCPHGPAEIIGHEETGFLVPVGDAQAMAAALGRMLQDDALRERVSRAGRERSRGFTARKIGEQYSALFAEVLARSGRSAGDCGENASRPWIVKHTGRPG